MSQDLGTDRRARQDLTAVKGGIKCRELLGQAQLWPTNCPYQQTAGFNRQLNRNTDGESC
jgi:hypothetical protein